MNECADTDEAKRKEVDWRSVIAQMNAIAGLVDRAIDALDSRLTEFENYASIVNAVNRAQNDAITALADRITEVEEAIDKALGKLTP